MKTYYVDFDGGCDLNDGLCEDTPKKSISSIKQRAGDRILFRRGGFFRGALDAKPHVSYGAYGEGEPPTFCLSVDVSAERKWVATENKNVWKCTERFDGEVGNIIFNRNECTATLRWSMSELCAEGDFYSNASEGTQDVDGKTLCELYLYSEENPSRAYTHIEAAPFGDRCAVRLSDGMTLDGIRVINSGVHGMAGHGNGITIRNCVFECIGGCACHRSSKIRFGNGVEIWEHGSDILIENCTFKNIYDSCVTYQGPGEKTVPCTRFICRNCRFDSYGMAAAEFRDKMPIDSCFNDNVCLDAGCGFAMLGETKPRMSEIWPEPMGHHVFLWRMPRATEGGSLTIKGNVFGAAPEGAVIYSIISKEAEDQITIGENVYGDGTLFFCHFGGERYDRADDFTFKHNKQK